MASSLKGEVAQMSLMRGVVSKSLASRYNGVTSKERSPLTDSTNMQVFCEERKKVDYLNRSISGRFVFIFSHLPLTTEFTAALTELNRSSSG